jgi:hypothetical protein
MHSPAARLEVVQIPTFVLGSSPAECVATRIVERLRLADLAQSYPAV